MILIRLQLKEARKRAGKTQKEIAEYVGISERHYRSIEAGERTGRAPLWDALEDLFKVPQRELREDAADAKEGVCSH